MRGARKLSLTVAVVVAAGAVLTGCGTPPWETAATDPPPVADETVTPTAAAPTPVPNDLSSGSTERTLTAGPLTIEVDYWSELTMERWTAGAVKPLNVAMSTTIVPDDGQSVYLQQARMTAVPRTDLGSLPQLDQQTDSASVNPGYLVLSPYSYSQTFNVGALPEDAVAVTLQLTYEFLVQTTPTSSEYAKQTVSDQLTIAIADAPR